MSRKILFVLANDAALGCLQNQKKVLLIQRMANHAHRQASDKFGLEPKLDEIPGLSLAQDCFGLLFGPFLRREADGCVAQSPAHYLFQTLESAADNEQNMTGVDGGRRLAPALREIHHRLDLTGDIVL